MVVCGEGSNLSWVTVAFLKMFYGAVAVGVVREMGGGKKVGATSEICIRSLQQG